MNWLSLVILMQSQTPGRIVTLANGLHVGIRPAVLVSRDEKGIGVTVQVSVR